MQSLISILKTEEFFCCHITRFLFREPFRVVFGEVVFVVMSLVTLDGPEIDFTVVYTKSHDFLYLQKDVFLFHLFLKGDAQIWNYD